MIQTSMSRSVYTKDYKEIIERLKKARVEADLSQQAVAAILHLKNRVRRKTA